jgi:hypothetical protein
VRHTEVQDLQETVRRQLQVRRLQVAVDHTLLVRRHQPSRQLRAQSDDVLLQQGPLVKLLLQRGPQHQLHHQEVDPVRLVEVVECRDVRVAQAREDRSFPAKATSRLFVGEGSGGQELQSDVPPQLLVPGAVDLAHAPGAESFHDAVVGERAVDHADLPALQPASA